mgnify:CR=1 FL=1
MEYIAQYRNVVIVDGVMSGWRREKISASGRAEALKAAKKNEMFFEKLLYIQQKKSAGRRLPKKRVRAGVMLNG